MRPAAALASSVVILAWGLAVMIAGAHVQPAPSAGKPEAAVTLPKPPAPVLETRHVRAINPGEFASPIESAGEALERIAPRPSLGVKEKERVAVVLLPRPWTGAAGMLAARGRRVKLAGIVPTELGRRCPSTHGGPWPCGVVARTQQRMLIRNRTVTCDHDEADWQGTLVTNCRIGETDVGAWLARNGWAEAENGSALADLTSAARMERRGIFGDDPRKGSNGPP